MNLEIHFIDGETLTITNMDLEHFFTQEVLNKKIVNCLSKDGKKIIFIDKIIYAREISKNIHSVSKNIHSSNFIIS